VRFEQQARARRHGNSQLFTGPSVRGSRLVITLHQAGTDLQEAYSQERLEHWNAATTARPLPTLCGRYYHRRIQEVYRLQVAPHQRVLEIGCGTGDLLAALQPAYGVGVDFSPDTIRLAEARHPDLHFVCADAHDLPLAEPFDVIVLSDLLNDVWDVQQVLAECRRLATPRTRLIVNSYSRVWQAPLTLARKLKLARPVLPQNWLTVEDLVNLLELADFEVIGRWSEVLCPVPLSLVSNAANRFVVRLWPFHALALTNFLIVRPQPQPVVEEPLVSVIVPARNEAGNIAEIFERVPEMGLGTELIFVEGHSRDDTYAAIEREMACHPERRCKLLRQTGEGKGDAVRLGFAEADGDILMILDADLTVPPEDLPRFYEALVRRKGEFINGVRLVYPMAGQAMRPLNFLGNKFFTLAFSWLLGQPIKDTLCGTKALWKRDYEQIAANRSHFGDFDPFGDFDLIFGATRLRLKLLDLPIRYRERTYGATNIRRWKHGWLLLQMVLHAARKLKFI
jgi:SAM-dependent methyltransferase